MNLSLTVGAMDMMDCSNVAYPFHISNIFRGGGGVATDTL